jgi:DNA-directed RNA polymerase sigma subunit (sigma70/sigma32)
MNSSNESDIRDKRKAMLKTILNNQEKQIISLRFGIPEGNNLTLNQVAKKLDMTVARIRKIEQGALQKLRENSSMQFLKDFL